MRSGRGVLTVVLAALVCEGLVAYGLLRLVGTPLGWSVLLAMPVAAVLALFLAAPPANEPIWSPLPEPPSAVAYLEAGTLGSRLADARTDHSRFRLRVQPRLAALALATLRSRPGLADLPDLADPRAAAALGPRLHALLTDPRATMPDPATLYSLLDALELP
jgi:hypothetical protein